MTAQPAARAKRMMSEVHFATDHTGKRIFVWDGTTYAEPPHYTSYARGNAASVFEAAGYGDGWDIPRSVETVREIRRSCANTGRVVTGVASGTDANGRPTAVFTNGHVDVRTGVLHPPSPATLIASQWGVPYDPLLPTPTYDRWVSDRGLTEQLPHIDSVLGSMFDSTYRHPRLVTLTGTWESGKSTLLELIDHIGNGKFPGSRTRHDHMVARFMCNMDDALRDTKRNVSPSVTTNNNVSVKQYLTGKRGLTRVQRLITEYPNNALHVLETVGEGWGLYEDEARKWESIVAKAGVHDLFLFMNPVPKRDSTHYTHDQRDAAQAVKQGLHDEATGIAARWLNAYRVSGLRVPASGAS